MPPSGPAASYAVGDATSSTAGGDVPPVDRDSTGALISSEASYSEPGAGGSALPPPAATADAAAGRATPDPDDSATRTAPTPPWTETADDVATRALPTLPQSAEAAASGTGRDADDTSRPAAGRGGSLLPGSGLPSAVPPVVGSTRDPLDDLLGGRRLPDALEQGAALRQPDSAHTDAESLPDGRDDNPSTGSGPDDPATAFAPSGHDDTAVTAEPTPGGPDDADGAGRWRSLS